MVVNYTKLMNDILKDFNKGAKCKTKYMFDLSDDTYIYVVINGYYILSIPRCFWLLDTEKLIDQGACNDHNHCFTTVNVCKMIKNTNMLDTKSFDFTCITSIDNKKVAVFSAGNDTDDIFINENFFKYFTFDLYKLNDEVIFSGSTKKAPLIIHEGNYFVGLLLPINH